MVEILVIDVLAHTYFMHHARHVQIRVTPEGEAYAVTAPQFPGCKRWASSVDEAIGVGYELIADEVERRLVERKECNETSV